MKSYYWWLRKMPLLVLNKRKGKKISKQKPKIKNKTHAEICYRKIQQNQNSTDFMSR